MRRARDAAQQRRGKCQRKIDDELSALNILFLLILISIGPPGTELAVHGQNISNQIFLRHCCGWKLNSQLNE